MANIYIKMSYLILKLMPAKESVFLQGGYRPFSTNLYTQLSG